MTSLITPAPAGSQLLLRRFGDAGTPVLLLHGLGQTAQVFNPTPDTGLAPWLAAAGYSVHVADLPMAVEDVSQHRLITEDLPALFDQLTRAHPGEPFFIISQGWGGVLAASALLRAPVWLDKVAGLVQIGVRRVCSQRSWRRRVLLDLMWGRIAPWLGRRHGSLALRTLGLGQVDISRQLHEEVRIWQNGGKWRDPQDCFDYAAAVTDLNWPGSLYIAGRDDHCLGHPADIRQFARELGVHDAQLVVLQKGTGSSRSYGHLDLLTHPQAAVDHYPVILSWMARHAARNTEQNGYEEA